MEMRNVKMIKSQSGSPDGVAINVYHADNVYELPADLAIVFVEKMSVARYHSEPTNIEAPIAGPNETAILKPSESRDDGHDKKHKRKV